MVHGQHIATTRQILQRIAYRWSRHCGVSAVLLVFEHEIDGTATPFCLPRWGGDPSLLKFAHDAEYAQTIQIQIKNQFYNFSFFLNNDKFTVPVELVSIAGAGIEFRGAILRLRLHEPSDIMALSQ